MESSCRETSTLVAMPWSSDPMCEMSIPRPLNPKSFRRLILQLRQRSKILCVIGDIEYWDMADGTHLAFDHSRSMILIRDDGVAGWTPFQKLSIDKRFIRLGGY